VRELVYVTNKVIGPKADDIRRSVRRDFNLYLDIWDRSWFLDRVNTHPQREEAAERLARAVVDPLLASDGLTSTKAWALTSEEARAGLVYLTLQWEDEIRDKGLTRVSFEALVRAVLRNTSSANRMTREQIHARVASIVETVPVQEIRTHVDAALTRLNKRVIRHWPTYDEFHLTHDESRRLRERLTELEDRDRSLGREISSILRDQFSKAGIKVEDVTPYIERIRRILEGVFLQRGEVFATSVLKGQPTIVSGDFVEEVARRDWNNHPENSSNTAIRSAILASCLNALLDPPVEVQAYLRSLADSYTLYAFLRQTPDVQTAVAKMFSFGKVWLDTSIILPVMAEELLTPEERKFTTLLVAARESGVELYATEGVVEEILHHLTLSLACARRQGDQAWAGQAPFMYSMFVASGRDGAQFADWLTFFRGEDLPMEDLAQYLDDRLGVEVLNLRKEAESAPIEIRGAVQEIWLEAHERRKFRYGREIGPEVMRRLVDHDVENYVGVTERRKEEKTGPLGFNAWWVTLDRTAFWAHEELERRLAFSPPPSPVLSPDFLSNYLSIGPTRRLLAKSTEARLPLMLDIGYLEGIPGELLDLVESVREENKDQPERIIARKIRDALNAARGRVGLVAAGGIPAMQEELLAVLEAQQQGGGPVEESERTSGNR
jgi:hypothetical protein